MFDTEARIAETCSITLARLQRESRKVGAVSTKAKSIVRKALKQPRVLNTREQMDCNSILMRFLAAKELVSRFDLEQLRKAKSPELFGGREVLDSIIATVERASALQRMGNDVDDMVSAVCSMHIEQAKLYAHSNVRKEFAAWKPKQHRVIGNADAVISQASRELKAAAVNFKRAHDKFQDRLVKYNALTQTLFATENGNG